MICKKHEWLGKSIIIKNHTSSVTLLQSSSVVSHLLFSHPHMKVSVELLKHLNLFESFGWCIPNYHDVTSDVLQYHSKVMTVYLAHALEYTCE